MPKGGPMKRFLFLFAAALCSAPLAAEVVSSVSFNPSRMGEYTYLKVSDTANLKGGLNTDVLNMSSNGTISFTTDNSNRTYEVGTITAPLGGLTVDMPSTVFHGDTANKFSSYLASSPSYPLGLVPNMLIRGGMQTYQRDSFIGTLDADPILQIRALTVEAPGLSIKGNGGASVYLYDGNYTTGFRLAGNDIPEPTASHTNTVRALTGCTMIWEKRKTSTNPPKEVFVLALKNCNGEIGPVIPSEPSTYTTSQTFTVFDPSDHPVGSCGNASSALPKDDLESLKMAREFITQASEWDADAAIGQTCTSDAFSNLQWEIAACNVAGARARLKLTYTVYYCN